MVRRTARTRTIAQTLVRRERDGVLVVWHAIPGIGRLIPLLFAVFGVAMAAVALPMPAYFVWNFVRGPTAAATVTTVRDLSLPGVILGSLFLASVGVASLFFALQFAYLVVGKSEFLRREANGGVLVTTYLGVQRLPVRRRRVGPAEACLTTYRSRGWPAFVIQLRAVGSGAALASLGRPLQADTMHAARAEAGMIVDAINKVLGVTDVIGVGEATPG